MMAAISAAIGENRQAGEVVNPTVGMMALDDISYYDEETGEKIKMEDIISAERVIGFDEKDKDVSEDFMSAKILD